jgi:hypothetical protein
MGFNHSFNFFSLIIHFRDGEPSSVRVFSHLIRKHHGDDLRQYTIDD